MNRKKRKVSKEKIRRVGKILEEFLIGNFESEFPLGGAAEESHDGAEPVEPREAVEQERDNVEEEQADEEVEDEAYDEQKYYFDLADVEYCVDVAITELIQGKLVPEYDSEQKAPTLSEIFEDLFGEDHKLTKQVEEFEEYISGYDEQVHIDDLQAAYNLMSEVVKELEDWGREQGG